MSNRKLDVRQQTFGFPDEELKTSLHDQIVLWVKGNAAEIGRKLIGWTETWDPQLIESIRQRTAAIVAERVNLLQESLTRDKSRLETIKRAQSIFYPDEGSAHRIEAMKAELSFLNSWEGLGDPPLPKLDVRCELEKAILRKRYETIDPVGYADIVVWVRASRLTAGTVPSDDFGKPYLGIDARSYAGWSVTWSDFRSFAFDAKNNIRSLGELLRQLKTYRIYSKFPFYVVSPDARFVKEISDEGFGFIKYPEALITIPKSRIDY